MSIDVREPKTCPRFGLGRETALHLIPGVLFLVAFVLLARLIAAWGLPGSFAAYIANLVVLVPVLVGVMWWMSRRSGGWKTVILYRRRLPIRRYLLIGGGTLAWAVLVFALVDPVLSAPLRDGLFSWVPDWFDLGRRVEGAEQLGRTGLVASWMLGLMVGSLVVPVAEEIYFRGFLLPRLERLGGWAPVLNTVLFAVYHVAQPWLIPTRILATLPLFWMVWRTRSMQLAIAVHVALNLVGDSLLTLPEVLG